MRSDWEFRFSPERTLYLALQRYVNEVLYANFHFSMYYNARSCIHVFFGSERVKVVCGCWWRLSRPKLPPRTWEPAANIMWSRRELYGNCVTINVVVLTSSCFSMEAMRYLFQILFSLFIHNHVGVFFLYQIPFAQCSWVDHHLMRPPMGSK